MSEFCSSCYEEDIHFGYDIDLYKAARSLKKGYSFSFLCEGCNRRAVYRDEEGLFYMVRVVNEEFVYENIQLEELKTKPFYWPINSISKFFNLN